ncbi:MAG: trypsin-like peptidase domain-containing protein, partial [Nanoarchaeota archaeon]|nr:trypsin-like peptidase domain-containing protein [Nanoarchaeota archaeon]
IEDASSVYVVDYDYNKYPVSIVGTASNVDLAVLKIEYNKTFDYLDFADSSDIRVGQRVIAVGNPLGLSFSVTEGIISSVNRVVDSTGIGYIQTDVPINAGNSGGPLINSNSKIVGINTFKLLDTEGLGFAIPADAAESIAEQAVK